MPQVRVTSCRQRQPTRGKTERESDGYVFTLEYDDPQKPKRYVVLWGFLNDLFKPNPDCGYVSTEFMAHYEDRARKRGDKLYKAAETLHRMIKFPAIQLADEKISPEDLKAIQEYEMNWAKEFQKTEGYWPPVLEAALPRGEGIEQTLSSRQLMHG